MPTSYSRLDYWTTEACNSLDGSRDTGGMPIDLDKEDNIPIFIGDLGRVINFKYEKEVS